MGYRGDILVSGLFGDEHYYTCAHVEALAETLLPSFTLDEMVVSTGMKCNATSLVLPVMPSCKPIAAEQIMIIIIKIDKI